MTRPFNQVNPKKTANQRGSALEIARVICLLMIALSHMGQYDDAIPTIVRHWFGNAAVAFFGLLTGYFYFQKPQLEFASKEVKNQHFNYSINGPLRKLCSRITFWVIVGNIIIGIIYVTYWQKQGRTYSFDSDNWYLWISMIVAIIGAVAQRIYFALKQNIAVIFTLVLAGIIMIIVGNMYINIDFFTFRLWRLGFLIFGLGFGRLVFFCKPKWRFYLGVICLLLSGGIIGIAFGNLATSDTFPNGSKVDQLLWFYLSAIGLFCLISLLRFESKFINKVAKSLNFILETHWIFIFTSVHLWAHYDAAVRAYGYLLVIAGSLIASPLLYYSLFLPWVKYVEPLLFNVLTQLSLLMRHHWKWWNKLIERRISSYEKAYALLNPTSIHIK